MLFENLLSSALHGIHPIGAGGPMILLLYRLVVENMDPRYYLRKGPKVRYMSSLPWYGYLQYGLCHIWLLRVSL